MLVFEERGKPEYQRKTSQSRVENQQTQSTYDARSGNGTRDTLVEGERSHHCANLAPQNSSFHPLIHARHMAAMLDMTYVL